MFAGTGERIEISHKASNRATFTNGALRAARFLADKDNVACLICKMSLDYDRSNLIPYVPIIRFLTRAEEILERLGDRVFESIL